MVNETNSSFNQNPIKRYFYKSDEAPIQNGSPQTSQPSNFYSPRFLRLSSRLPYGRPEASRRCILGQIYASSDYG